MTFLLAPYVVQPAENMPVTSEVSKLVVKRIREKYVDFYRKYKGVETKREKYTRYFDQKTGKVKKTERVVYLEKSYFYEEPIIEVLEYEKNGKKLPVSKYKRYESELMYHIFDERGKERFDVRVVGFKMIKGNNCYVIKVMPRERTERHYKGNIFFSVDTLNLISFEGTLGKYPIGLDELDIQLFYESKGDFTTLKNSVVNLFINVPVIMPHTRIAVDTKILEYKPIPN